MSETGTLIHSNGLISTILQDFFQFWERDQKMLNVIFFPDQHLQIIFLTAHVCKNYKILYFEKIKSMLSQP